MTHTIIGNIEGFITIHDQIAAHYSVNTEALKIMESVPFDVLIYNILVDTWTNNLLEASKEAVQHE